MWTMGARVTAVSATTSAPVVTAGAAPTSLASQIGTAAM